MTAGSLEHEPQLIRSFDGTSLAAREMGSGRATPLLVVNAVGANLAAWRRSLIDLARERRIITWDHRGLHGSGPAATERFDPGAQAEDAMAVLAHFDVERFAIASWSNGTRIALEIAARYPEQVAALALISGGYGSPPGRLLRFELGSALPVVASVAKYFAGPLRSTFQKVVARPEISGLVRQSGMVGATAETPALVELLRGMARCDLRTLLESYEEVAGDSGEELLSDIQAPTLIIAGDRDQFTSTRMVEELVAGIPQAHSIVYQGATHYLPLEFPARLSADLRTFLSELAL